MNTKVVKGADGVIREEKWKVGGIYGPAIEKICEELEKAKAVAENDTQKKEISDFRSITGPVTSNFGTIQHHLGN